MRVLLTFFHLLLLANHLRSEFQTLTTKVVVAAGPAREPPRCHIRVKYFKIIYSYFESNFFFCTLEIPLPEVLLHIPASKSTNVCIVHVETIFVASWSSGNAFVSGAGGLRFKSRAGQIDKVLSMARNCCNIFSKETVLPGRNGA